MKKRINNVLAMFAVALFMGLSINGFSQEKQTQPKDSTSNATVNEGTMMEECMSEMDSDMMRMCGKMMANMKENSSMCCNKMMNDTMDEQDIKGDQPEKENPSDESKKQREMPEIKG